MRTPSATPKRAGLADSSATECPTYHWARSPWAEAQAWRAELARGPRSMMTVAKGDRDGPRSLDAARNCCHHVEGWCFNCPGALSVGVAAEPVFSGAAAVVPHEAIRAPAKITAAPEARGFFINRGRWRAARAR